jgi:AbiTii
MKALVPQFQEELAFGTRKTSELLRMAKLISAKLNLDNITQWINHELNGYPEGATLPAYRCLKGGSLQYQNPYKGWEDIVGHKNVSMPQAQPLTELEVFAEAKTIAISPRTPYPLVALIGDPHEFPEFKQRVLFPGSQVVALLGAVKNKLLDWTCQNLQA